MMTLSRSRISQILTRALTPADDDGDSDGGVASAVPEPPEPPDIVAPPSFMRCFQHWLLTMRGILRALSATATNNPGAASPKCVSLLQMGDQVVWFALEASQTHPKLEGRIVGLDDSARARVKYKDPGPKRINILDIAPGLSAGVNRFLLHTGTAHLKPADMRIAIDDDSLMVARLWHNILCREDASDVVRCRGCGNNRQPCPLCMASQSEDCCVDDDCVNYFDVMHQLGLGLARDVCVGTAAPPMLLPEMRRMDLCSFCALWFSERERALGQR